MKTKRHPWFKMFMFVVSFIIVIVTVISHVPARTGSYVIAGPMQQGGNENKRTQDTSSKIKEEDASSKNDTSGKQKESESTSANPPDAQGNTNEEVAVLAAENAERQQAPAATPEAQTDPASASTLPATPTPDPATNGNNDAIGWLTIHNTAINYPIVQGTDNEFYLTHDSNKNSSSDGAIFLDYRQASDFSNGNNIIYGHNNSNGKMFSELVKFKDKAYFDSHTSGTLQTSSGTYNLQIFSVYVHTYEGNPFTWYFVAKNPFINFVNQIRQDSMYLRDMDINWGDRILTLSTCSFEYGTARTIVHAKIG